MRSEKWKNAAVAAVLTFLAAYGGIGCMVSGLELEADMTVLAVGCAIMAITFCACFSTRLALLPICLAALLVGYWWKEGTLRLSMESLIYQISALYDQGYGWGLLQWTERNLLPDDVTPALLTVMLPVVMAVSATVVKGRLGWLGAGAALLPMISCVVLKDTVPGELWLGMLLLAVMMILMTEHARRADVCQGRRLVLMLALPMLLATVLLFALSPKETYTGQAGAQKLEDFVLRLFDQNEVPELWEGTSLVAGDQEKVVRLENVGRRADKDTPIMTVKAQESTTLYLRGCAYDIYDGTSWSSTPGWNSWSLYYVAGGSEVKSLQIQTKSVHSVLYFTYVPYEAETKVLGGRMRNDGDLRSYTVYYQEPITYDESLDARENEIGGQQLAEYLELPDSTRARAEQLLYKKIGVPTETISAGQIWKNAMLICEWVSKRADYDLNTGKMPDSEDDFAMWFLEKADTGYCTHFASAAVVLLRAAGIPAQYVTGYVVETKAGQEVTVTEANAHAWVEVFINGVGWVRLDPTPSEGIQSSSQPGQQESVDQPDEPTGPDETVKPTDPEHTTEPSTPEESTGPVATTEPEGTVQGTVTETEMEATGQTGESTGESGGGEAQGGVGTSGSGGTPERGTFGKVLVGVLVGIGLLLLVTAAVWAQWRLRVWLRERHLKAGNANQRLLARWSLLERMAKCAGQTPDESLFWLAQKARFSQHRITHEELDTMDRELCRLREQLREDSLPRRFLYTLILALY